MAGTLSIWMVILFFGAVSMLLFGFFNVYVPKDQEEMAKLDAFARDFETGQKLSISSRVHLGRVLYMTVPCVISMMAMAFFIIEDFLEYSEKLGGGFPGTIICIVFMLVAFFLAYGLLIFLPFLGELIAYSDLERRFERRYGVNVRPPEE